MCRDSSTARLRLLVLLIPIFVVGMLFVAAPGYGKSRGRGYRSGEVKYLNPALDSGKVSPLIRLKKEEIQAQAISRRATRALGAPALSNRLVKVDGDGSIHAYIRVDTFGSAERAQLEARGVRIEIVNEDYGIIQAWVPLDKIEEVADISFVKRVAPPSYATTMAGSVTTEGDSILNADQLRALGFDGSGIRVGVISDGVDNLTVAQDSGDLPATVTIQTHAGSGDEGTAMLEIVHDLAPGAELGFCSGMTTLQMLDCVDDLTNVFGADIIVDDLGFFNMPFFEDGPIALAVESVVSSGVFYISSAGNQAQEHYQGPYVDSGDGDHSHEISLGDNVFNVTGALVTVILQWSNLGGASSDDYDLCLESENATACAFANDIQDGDDLPFEARVLPCGGPGCDIQVRLISGNAQSLELFVLDGTLDINDRVTADSIFGHAAVPGVVAAAAVNQATPNTIEVFSSRGPSTIRFPAAETRQKPDLTATDGVAVSGAGGFPSPFGGTSASAPHVAGVAALLMSGGRTASAARTALRQTAVDLGTAGIDTTYGYGRIDALAAYGFLQGALQFELRVDDDDGGGGSDNFCFISTAAHGSPIVLQVDVLKKFLDGFLRINRASSQQSAVNGKR
jgi:subtilisin family serine protease